MKEGLITDSLTPTPSAGERILQRKCACGQHTIGGSSCSSCSKERDSRLQRASIAHDPANVQGNAVPPIVHEVLNSPGQPLDGSTRAFFEPRFGHDFSHTPSRNSTHVALNSLTLGAPGDRFEQEADRVAGTILSEPAHKAAGGRTSPYDFGGVRIHSDARAALSARALGARAYTIGRHIVFGEREYAPQSSTGRHLLAHELTHVVQQNGQVISRSPSDVREFTSSATIQRTTVDVRKGCQGTAADITAAVTDALTGIARIADPEAKACLLKELNAATVVCEPFEKDCGSTRYVGSTITINKWGGGCPSLPALLVHEAAHKCKVFYTEAFAEACENEAYGGSGATPPGPDETGGKCEL